MTVEFLPALVVRHDRQHYEMRHYRHLDVATAQQVEYMLHQLLDMLRELRRNRSSTAVERRIEWLVTSIISIVLPTMPYAVIAGLDTHTKASICMHWLDSQVQHNT